MKNTLSVLHRLREVALLLAQIKWDEEDVRRERRSHDEEWRRTGLSKNILDGLVIRTIGLVLRGDIDSCAADGLIADLAADFRAVKIGDGTPISGRLPIRKADPGDPCLGMGFAEALDKRIDRFVEYASVPFPGKAMKSNA
jgi:hypothetical protein